MPSVTTTYLSPGKAAAWLTERGVSTSEATMRRWAQAGRVQAIKLPFGRLRISVDELEAILDPTAGAA